MYSTYTEEIYLPSGKGTHFGVSFSLHVFFINFDLGGHLSESARVIIPLYYLIYLYSLKIKLGSFPFICKVFLTRGQNS